MVIRSLADLAAKTTPGARLSREAPGTMPAARGRMPNVKGSQRRPALSLPWASIALASVATAFIPARSQAAQATLGCPGTGQTGAQFVAEVTVDVGTSPPANGNGYKVTITTPPSTTTTTTPPSTTTTSTTTSSSTTTTTPSTTTTTSTSSTTSTSGQPSTTTTPPSTTTRPPTTTTSTS